MTTTTIFPLYNPPQPSTDLMQDPDWYRIFPNYTSDVINSRKLTEAIWDISFEDIKSLINFYDQEKGIFRKLLHPFNRTDDIEQLIKFCENKSGLLRLTDKHELIDILTTRVDKAHTSYDLMDYLHGDSNVIIIPKASEKGVFKRLGKQSLTNLIYMVLGSYFVYNIDYVYNINKQYRGLIEYLEDQRAFFDISQGNHVYDIYRSVDLPDIPGLPYLL